MATITGLTAERMQEIIDSTIVDADVIGDNLILTKDDGSTIDAGSVRGPAGPAASNLGKGAAFPGAPTDGDLFVRTDQTGDPLYKFTDGAWASAGGGLNKVTGFPATPQDGDVIVRTDLNGSPMFAYSTENGWEQTPRMGAVTVPSARVRRTTVQAIPNATTSSVNFDTADHNTDGMFVLASPTRLTIKTPGIYLVSGNVDWAVNAAGPRNAWAFINGDIMNRVAEVMVDASGAGDSRLTFTGIRRFAAGDYIELGVYQGSGGTLNLTPATSQSNLLSATWLGGPGQTVDERGVPAVKLGHSATQNIPNDATTSLTFDTERFDTDSMHDPAVNANRITIKTPGLYQVQGNMRLPTTAYNGIWEFAILKNGSQVGLNRINGAISATNGGSLNVSATVLVAAGDYLELSLYQASGGALAVGGNTESLLGFSAVLIGSGKTVTPYSRVYKSAAPQTVPVSTSAYISYDAERADNDNIHDPSTNNTRMTCRTGGVYNIKAHVSVTGSKGRLCIVKNRTDYLAVIDLIFTNNKYTEISTIAELAVGDYIELFVIEDSGTTAIVLAATVGATTQYQQDLEMVKIGAPIAGQTGIDPVEGLHVVGAAGEPAFTNGWAARQSIQFYKDRSRVFLSGLLNGTAGTTSSPFTLPIGYRPLQNCTFTSHRNDGTSNILVEVNVQTDGVVTVKKIDGTAAIGAGNDYIGLDGLSFRI